MTDCFALSFDMSKILKERRSAFPTAVSTLDFFMLVVLAESRIVRHLLQSRPVFTQFGSYGADSCAEGFQMSELLRDLSKYVETQQENLTLR